MLLVLLGNYDASIFEGDIHLNFLLVLVSFVNYFFIFTLLVAIAVFAFQKKNMGIQSN